MANPTHISHTFKHAAIYSGSNLLGKIISFIMLPLYAHYIRAEGYGIIGMIDVVLSVATMMIGYGITGAMWRFYFDNEDEEERNIFVSTTIVLMFIIVVLVSLPVLVFHEPIARLVFGKEGLGFCLVIATLSFIAEMTSRSAEAYILLRQKPLLIVSISLFRLIFGVFFNIYFIVYLKMGVMGFLYTGLIGSVLATIIMHTYAIYSVGFHFKKEFASKVLGFSMPLIPGQIASFVRGNADRMILRSFLGLGQLGTFEMLFKFASLIGMFIVEPIHKIWGVKRFEICDKPEGPVTIARMFTLQTALLLFFALVLSLEVPLLLKILTPREFWVSEWIVFLAVYSRLFNPTYQQFNFGLQYAKKTFKISIIEIVTALTNVVFNLVLIYKYQLMGAVVSAVIGGSVQCTMAFYMARRYYPLDFEWGKLFRLLIASIGLFVLINNATVTNVPLITSHYDYLAHTIQLLLSLLHLDTMKEGILLRYATNNIPLILDAQLKLMLSLLFLPLIVALRVIRYDAVKQLLPFKLANT